MSIIRFWEDITKEWEYRFYEPSMKAQIEFTIKALKILQELEKK